MKNRIQSIFLNKSKKLVTFVTGGDPNFKNSLKIINQLAESGVDIIEIGMPFSDPMADGPIIQLASQRAIEKNIDLNKIFKICKNFRKKNNHTPIILMGYYNPIHYFGDKKFINKCSKSGIDGLIIVDLQPENDGHLSSIAKKNNIEFIRLVTPTTDKLRLQTILANASGFLYYVSITGITGAKFGNIKKLKSFVNNLKNKTKLPVIVGFGIKTNMQAKKISKFADGIVVGSSIVEMIQEHFIDKISLNNTLKKINNFIKSLKKAIK